MDKHFIEEEVHNDISASYATGGKNQQLSIYIPIYLLIYLSQYGLTDVKKKYCKLSGLQKNKNVFPVVPETDKSKNKIPYLCILVRILFLGHSWHHLVASANGGRDQKDLWDLFFNRPISFMSDPPSLPNYFPNTSSPNTVRYQDFNI